MRLVFLISDYFLFFLFFVFLFFLIRALNNPVSRSSWKRVFYHPWGLFSILILFVYFSVALLDSVHFVTKIPSSQNNHVFYSNDAKSLLDQLIFPIGTITEKTYSAPFATTLYTKQTAEDKNGNLIRTYLPLLINKNKTHLLKTSHIIWVFVNTGIVSLLFGAILFSLITFLFSLKRKLSFLQAFKILFNPHGGFPWKTCVTTVSAILFFFSIFYLFSGDYHIFGTDKVGQDVLYEALKSIRTGILIGTLTTLVTLPFAIILGISAGYFGGWMDDGIQYIYTVLSSIPGVLLIAASVLSIQIYINNHPSYFLTMNARADLRLVILCFILGITSWTSLCRILRAETLKLRELDYVHAATLLGSSSWRIIKNHLLPNLGHLILITIVLDFSGLVLAEAVLTYVGVGVDPTTYSWGNMIDTARLELARDPVVWWPLTSAFCLMFIFILAANLFADRVRDAFNPRSTT